MFMSIAKNLSMIFSIVFYICINLLAGEHDETMEMVVYVVYGIINKVWLFFGVSVP